MNHNHIYFRINRNHGSFKYGTSLSINATLKISNGRKNEFIGLWVAVRGV